MPKREVVIYHNPKCTTSCNVLAMIEEAGVKPTVVEYLTTGWTKQQLKDLFAAAGVTPRRALRTKSKEAEELGLLDPKITSAKLLAAMVEHPVLVERPFVTAPKGTRLCRPKDLVKELL